MGIESRGDYLGLLVGSLLTASRFAWLPVCEYRSNIFVDIQPASAFIVESGTPTSPRADIKVCRKSCSRHHTPAALRQVVHADLIEAIGLVGSRS